MGGSMGVGAGVIGNAAMAVAAFPVGVVLLAALDGGGAGMALPYRCGDLRRGDRDGQAGCRDEDDLDGALNDSERGRVAAVAEA